MQYTINEIYTLLLQNINNVYGIFKNHFEESHVDLQFVDTEEHIKRSIFNKLNEKGINIPDNDYNTKYEISEQTLNNVIESLWYPQANIYVYWDKVTVTNENDRSVDIQDLYAKVTVQLNGKIPYENLGFLLNRATYSKTQFLSDYMHSHIHCIPKDDFRRFMPPCLGHGPIANTILTLKDEYDEAMWMLFCQELSMYVTVESLKGVPWKKLEEIGQQRCMLDYNDYKYSLSNIGNFTIVFNKEKLKSFISYYLQYGHLSFKFHNGEYHCAMPFYQYIIDISNAFICWFNLNIKSTQSTINLLYKRHLLHKAIIIDRTFYHPKSDNSSESLDSYRNKYVLTFKGKKIFTSIIESSEDEEQISNILDASVAVHILRKILRTINFKYHNEHSNHDRGENSSPTTNQRVFYIQDYSSSEC